MPSSLIWWTKWFEPHPPDEVALRQSDRIVFRLAQRRGRAVFAAALLDRPVDEPVIAAGRIHLVGVDCADDVGESRKLDDGRLRHVFGERFRRGRAAAEGDLDLRPVEIFERRQVLSVGPGHQRQHVGGVGVGKGDRLQSLQIRREGRDRHVRLVGLQHRHPARDIGADELGRDPQLLRQLVGDVDVVALQVASLVGKLSRLVSGVDRDAHRTAPQDVVEDAVRGPC